MKQNKILYWLLISAFSLLYIGIAFVSTIHAISFFQLANTLTLAIILGACYEIGQSSVLFAILMTENRNRFLAWAIMFLLTAVQISGNVYASFKFMDTSGSNDWTFWQRAILFGVQADSPEMYKVIISWISGALLPIVALGMTALVAENIRLARGEKLGEEENDLDEEKIDIKEEIIEKPKEKDEILEDEIESEEFNHLLDLQDQIQLKEEKIPKIDLETGIIDAKPSKVKSKEEKSETDIESITKEIDKEISERIITKPVNKVQGWHFMNEFIDDKHNVFQKGKFLGNDPNKIPTSKKA